MNALDTVSDVFRSRTIEVSNRFKSLIFGANNEKLDFLMDSFYKLSPPQRTTALASIVVMIVLFVMSAIGLYVVRIKDLDQELNASIAAVTEIEAFRKNFRVEDDKYNALTKQVLGRVRSERLKTFAAKVADDLGVKLEPGNPKDVPLPPENPLSEQLQEVHLELVLRKVSIPRLLKYVSELERAKYFIRVEDLKISGIYGTKLYFNADLKIRGYRPI